MLQISSIPDGNQVNWLFLKGLAGGEEVVIDLLDVHPLPNTFQQDAVLQDLRFRYEQGSMVDTEVCDYILIGDLDRNCRIDFHDVALMADNWLVDCMENPQNPGCVPE